MLGQQTLYFLLTEVRLNNLALLSARWLDLRTLIAVTYSNTGKSEAFLADMTTFAQSWGFGTSIVRNNFRDFTLAYLLQNDDVLKQNSDFIQSFRPLLSI